MANTTNYNWETPDDTDLVKDGAAAIRTLGSSVDTTTKALNPSTTLGDIEYRSATANTNTRLAVGTTGQVLTVAGGVPSWATPTVGDITAVTAGTGISGGGTTGDVTITNSMATAIDAKGDLVVGTGADAFSRLAVGTNTYVLTADSAEATGLKWAAPSGGSTFVGVQVTKTANTSVGSGANAQIPWDSEAFDTDGFHDNSTNNARLTVPSGKGGYYKVYFAMQWASSVTVARRIVAIYKNGNSSTGTFINNFETSSINFPSCAMAFTMNLSAADWIEIDAYQGTAGALDFRSSNAIFGMEKIG